MKSQNRLNALSSKELLRSYQKKLRDNEKTITDELISCQGDKVDIGGYYRPNAEIVEKAMRPSKTLNSLLNSVE